MCIFQAKRRLNPVIKVEHLFYEYPGKRALSDVSFTIGEGSITALVGPNGAGKTTLLRCIAGLDEPFSGAIQVAGIDVAEHPRRVHKELGYLSDFFGLYNDLTIRQCLTYSAHLHQMPESKIEQQVLWASGLLGLVPYLTHKAGTLSRGWRQRLGIAQAIIHSPRLLLLDEPASGLDPEARIALSQLFRHLRDQGMTLVVSSHILAELEDYCTDMLVLREGCVVEHRKSAGTGKEKESISITFLENAELFIPLLQEVSAVSGLLCEKHIVRFEFAGNDEDRYILLRTLIERGARISDFSQRHTRLQDVYLSLSHEGKPA